MVKSLTLSPLRRAGGRRSDAPGMSVMTPTLDGGLRAVRPGVRSCTQLQLPHFSAYIGLLRVTKYVPVEHVQ